MSLGDSYIVILNQKYMLWIPTRNAISPTFLMSQILMLYGNTWISVIDSRNDSGMLDSMRSFKNTLTNLFHSYFQLNVCTRIRYNNSCLIKYKGLFY